MTPPALRALDFEDRSDDDASFDCAGYYYANLAGNAALTLGGSVYVIIH